MDPAVASAVVGSERDGRLLGAIEDVRLALQRVGYPGHKQDNPYAWLEPCQERWQLLHWLLRRILGGATLPSEASDGGDLCTSLAAALGELMLPSVGDDPLSAVKGLGFSLEQKCHLLLELAVFALFPVPHLDEAKRCSDGTTCAKADAGSDGLLVLEPCAKRLRVVLLTSSATTSAATSASGVLAADHSVRDAAVDAHGTGEGAAGMSAEGGGERGGSGGGVDRRGIEAGASVPRSGAHDRPRTTCSAACLDRWTDTSAPLMQVLFPRLHSSSPLPSSASISALMPASTSASTSMSAFLWGAEAELFAGGRIPRSKAEWLLEVAAVEVERRALELALNNHSVQGPLSMVTAEQSARLRESLARLSLQRQRFLENVNKDIMPMLMTSRQPQPIGLGPAAASALKPASAVLRVLSSLAEVQRCLPVVAGSTDTGGKGDPTPSATAAGAVAGAARANKHGGCADADVGNVVKTVARTVQAFAHDKASELAAWEGGP